MKPEIPEQKGISQFDEKLQRQIIFQALLWTPFTITLVLILLSSIRAKYLIIGILFIMFGLVGFFIKVFTKEFRHLDFHLFFMLLRSSIIYLAVGVFFCVDYFFRFNSTWMLLIVVGAVLIFSQISFIRMLVKKKAGNEQPRT